MSDKSNEVAELHVVFIFFYETFKFHPSYLQNILVSCCSYAPKKTRTFFDFLRFSCFGNRKPDCHTNVPDDYCRRTTRVLGLELTNSILNFSDLFSRREFLFFVPKLQYFLSFKYI